MRKLKRWQKIKTSVVLRTYFYKFLSLKRKFITRPILNNLLIQNLLALLLVEKNKAKCFYTWYRNLLFKRKVQIVHKKTMFIKKLKFFWHFNKDFFPELNRKRFLKRLFWFWQKKFMWSKLRKINHQVLKILIYHKWERFYKWEIYFLSWDVLFPTVNFFGFNVYHFKKKFFWLTSFKLFFWANWLIKKILNTNKKFTKAKKKIKISKILSKKLKKIFFNKIFIWKFENLNKKILHMQIRTDSFYKIFRYEFSVPFQFLFFWKSILWFTKAELFIFPSKNILLSKDNLSNIVNFLLTKYQILGYSYDNYINLSIPSPTFIPNSFSFFNIERLEKILLPIFIFFKQFKKSYWLPIINLYTDMFFIRKRSVPPRLRKLLEKILLQLTETKNVSPLLSEDTQNNTLLTVLFYNFVSEIFEIVFNFSPGKVVFLNSLHWKHLFHAQIGAFSTINWNWDYLNLFSRAYGYIWRQFLLPAKTFINWKLHKKSFFDFSFFVWKKVWWKYWKLKWLEWKIEKFDLKAYLAKTYFPSAFIRSQLYSWLFYMWRISKQRWFTSKINFGKLKVIYDSYLILKTNFWYEFYNKKSSFEWLYMYGFTYRTGQLDFKLDWNFFTSYSGKLGFKIKKKVFIKVGKKNLLDTKVREGFFAIKKFNALFFTFFSFLNWIYLLQYLLQFGHTNANYNTSYKNYLIMVYNERFILNMLNIQLNLKRNLKLMFKMFYLGGLICLVGTFNILLEGLVGIYGCYSDQPYTRFIWVNGMFSNFDKIFLAIQKKIADLYSAWVYLSRKMVRELMHLWFSMKGLFKNLSIDISFFPSVYWSSWGFLEACAKFYPTITVSNTQCFLPTVFLEYTLVSNDYSLLSLSLYINLLIIIFKKSKLMRQNEFSVYPQKLLAETFWFKILPYEINIKHYKLFWQMKMISTFIWKSLSIYFDVTPNRWIDVFKYLFLHRWQMLNILRRQNFWWFFKFSPRKNLTHQTF
jgi:ribosomal protein S2